MQDILRLVGPRSSFLLSIRYAVSPYLSVSDFPERELSRVLFLAN